MAISKERLEELKEKNATVYELLMNKEVLKVELNNNYYIMLDKVYENKLGKLPLRPHWLSDLFETKKDAEWTMRFKRIPRTDYLDLPTWEEFKKKQLKNKCYCVPFIGANPGCFYQLFIDAKTEEITIYDCDCEDIVFSMKQNQKNYTLACEKARELFLGEQQ